MAAGPEASNVLTAGSARRPVAAVAGPPNAVEVGRPRCDSGGGTAPDLLSGPAVLDGGCAGL
ncbi:hypothetical protein ABT317_48395, partial [Streptomyces carpinensis]